MKQFTNCAWVLAHKEQIVNCFMSGASSHECEELNCYILKEKKTKKGADS